MIPLAKIANNLKIMCVASAVSRYLKDLCSNKSITFHILSYKITPSGFVESNKILPTNQ
jgi:predicted transcriptional regulator